MTSVYRRRALAAGLLLLTGLVVGGARPAVADGPMLHRWAAGGHELPVLVAPERPGWNLVLLPDEHGAAGTAPDRLVPAGTRPGTTGGWVKLWLRRGDQRIWVRQHGQVAPVRVNAVGGGAEQSGLTGADGPECVTALLGRLLAARSGRPGAGSDSGLGCPHTELTSQDRDALTRTVSFLAARGTRALTLVSDASPRSRAAVEAVRAAAGPAGLRVDGAGQADAAVLVVSGWATAETVLGRIADGRLPAQATYLAPWLLSPPLLRIAPGAAIPLTFTPDGASARAYLASLADAFAGTTPTASGYAAWSATAGDAAENDRAVRLYVAARLDLNPPGVGGPRGQAAAAGAHGGHGGPVTASAGVAWVPGGRLTAVSTPLPA